MTEWPKVYAWKAYVLYPSTAGSNPALSVAPPPGVQGPAQSTIAEPRQDRKGAAVGKPVGVT